MTASKRPPITVSMEDSDDADIASARRLFRLEADGITALAETIGDSFSAAVQAMHDVKGRVIVSGMGKSGHVGRKIAATLASTGTPAHYVHPGEASHGDLGMVTREDAVLALSNSGETPELRDIAEFTRRFSIPLIGMTSGVGSALTELSDVVLLLPAMPEACPMGLAPTTSTTMSLAMGDALAVALLERKGFSAQDFRILHPGGKLGNTLLRVSDLMHNGDALPLAMSDVSMRDVIPVMSEKRFGCVGIVDNDGALVGIVTDGDLRRTLAENLLSKSVVDVMTTAPKTITSQALAAEAVAVMNNLQITNLFVVEEKPFVPIGILHIHDLLKAGIT